MRRMDESTLVALYAVAVGSGLSGDRAWAVVDEVSSTVTDVREAANVVASKAGELAWGGTMIGSPHPLRKS